MGDYGKPTKREGFFSPPTTVNACYMPDHNSITFPAGILQPPFYRSNSLMALNYGGIGQILCTPSLALQYPHYTQPDRWLYQTGGWGGALAVTILSSSSDKYK
ncbi:Endothelin-converting enzyme 2 [Portunus trituberculatus]|uniref:Endothelin-converting enzyme 2 n=1 Tax=Portunus trituberculatus TaxID=210409 RepID=A0A5B7JGE7_PORTR|nr:Endothelin-converting enzyme 2 [Portunus trituberculatus]